VRRATECGCGVRMGEVVILFFGGGSEGREMGFFLFGGMRRDILHYRSGEARVKRESREGDKEGRCWFCI
jgi:hypothetical protein